MSGHGRFQELAAKALDFGSSADEAKELAAHRGTCAECRRFEAGLRADDELVRTRRRTHAPDRVRQAVAAAAYRPVPRSRVGRILPVLGAAAVLLVLMAGFGWITRARIDGPGQLPVRTWLRLGDVPAFANGSVSDALGTGAQLIAVGSVTEGGHRVAAVWMSPDGLSWQRLPTNASFVDGEALSVAFHDNTLMVAGVDESPAPGRDAASARVWLTQGQRSCDSCSAPPSGDPWQATGIPFPPGRVQAPLFAAIAAGGPGFVFVGREIKDVSAGDAPLGAIVATSADGATWAFNDPAGPEFAGSSMAGVAAGPSGLVAVGQTGLAPTVWVSADGLTWTRLSAAIDQPGATLRSVAAGPSGFVAVGDVGGSGLSWVSADGRSWQAAPSSPSLANARMLRVDRVGAEFIATGSYGGDGIAWSSADGLSWTKLDTGSIFTGAQMRAAVGIRSTYVLFGTDDTGRAVAAVSEGPGQP